MPDRIHHLNCGTLCPPIARMSDRAGRWLRRGRLVCHCLLIEQGTQLVLVDTGLGTQDCNQAQRLPRTFRVLAAPQKDQAETAIDQVRGLGFDPVDVRHIVVTHLDLDHAGGISDFPWAKVHVHARELLEARAPRGRRSFRYLPSQLDGAQFCAYDELGESFMGLSAIRPLEGLGDDIALVPLFGHSAGHSGVSVGTIAGCILHAGDAYFDRGELESDRRPAPGLGLFQRVLAHDNQARLANQGRLRELAFSRPETVRIFCSHDPVEFDRHATASPAARPGG